MVTVRGDIAYSWKLLNADTAARYEEGDVVGLFPNKSKPNDRSYLDLLTPNNYKEAILAGVITRSYYIAANSQDGMSIICLSFERMYDRMLRVSALNFTKH